MQTILGSGGAIGIELAKALKKYTSEIRLLYENIKDKVNIIKELEKTFYGATEFSILDLNGYILTFAEEEK